MKEEGLNLMAQKMLDSLVTPKFPEIYEINIKSLKRAWQDDPKYNQNASKVVFSLVLDVHVDGTDEEQEDEIINVVHEVLDYTGFDFFLKINWVVER